MNNFNLLSNCISLIVSHGAGTRFLISKFLITKFLITKFLITKFLMHRIPNHKIPNHKKIPIIQKF
jgi:hypothetical protein